MSDADSHMYYEEHPYTNGSYGTPTFVTSPASGQITRTVAIIKNHALAHRFEIEPRILAASFEIVKERQMEFDTTTDPATLEELFGEDAASLAEGPVWVYVLERRRAVEVWNTLMGERDPNVARRNTPNSLRALYGISREQNAFMGSPDNETAEIQIASLFVSSPPFPISDLPEDHYGSVSSISSNGLNQLRRSFSDNGGEYAPSSTTGASTAGSRRTNNKAFRARPIPATMTIPDIVPRTTRAAELRAGTAVMEKTSAAPRVPLSKERLQETFANVPGHKRTGVIQVASTAAPAIAPRMTRAASLRLGQSPQSPQSPPKKRESLTGSADVKAMFEGVPGHKRRETITVASIKPPAMAPRLNKSAALRVAKDKESAPPSSFAFKPTGSPKAPGLTRSNSSSSVTGSNGDLNSTGPTISRPASRVSVAQPSPRRVPSRPSSVIGNRPATATPKPPPATPSRDRPTRPPSTTGTPSHVRSASSAASIPSSSPVATRKAAPRPSSIDAPTIAPRTNRSAALRLAKQEAEAAAAAKTALAMSPQRKATRSGAPPSSFKTLAV